MKNFKNIHNFESFLTEKESFDKSDAKPNNASALVKAKLEDLSPEQKAQLKKELLNTAKTLGLRPEDLTDTKKVQAALSKKSSVLESEINEGLKDWFKKISAKAMQLFGLGNIMAGIAGLAVNAQIQSGLTDAADLSGASVSPGAAAVVGGVALAIGLAATIVGITKANKEA